MQQASRTQSKILIVDDDEVYRNRLGRAFVDRGYDVRTAEDYDTAVAAATEESPELAVVDLKMPGTRGLELVEERLVRRAEALERCELDDAAHERRAEPMEAAITRAEGSAPGDTGVEAAIWGNVRAMLRLHQADRHGALAALDRATCLLRARLPGEHFPHWGLWALLRTLGDEGRQARAFQADARSINEKVRLYARIGTALIAAAVRGHLDQLADDRLAPRQPAAISGVRGDPARQIVGAENVRLDDQTHTQTVTSPETFKRLRESTRCQRA